MTHNTGGPAFPGLHPSQECRFNDPGMTLRDYFAAKAMSAYLDRPNLPINVSDEQLAFASYDMADAMLKAREQ